MAAKQRLLTPQEPDFLKKLSAAGNILKSVVTANSVNKDTVTELIVVSELTQGKKKVVDTVTLTASAFFQVKGLYALLYWNFGMLTRGKVLLSCGRRLLRIFLQLGPSKMPTRLTSPPYKK